MSEATTPVPGSFEIGPLSMAETLDVGFQLLKSHFTVLGVLSLLGQAPTILVFMLFGWMLDPFALQNGELPDIGAVFIVSVALWVLAMLVLLPVVIGAITAVVSDIYLGAEVSVSGALQRGVARMFPLMFTYIIFSLILIVAMFLAVAAVALVFVALGGLFQGSAVGVAVVVLLVLVAVPAMFALGGLLTLVPGVLAAVVVLEGISYFEAVARTWTLVSSALTRFIGLGLVIYMLLLILPTGVQFMVGAIPVVGAVVWGIVQALCQAYLYTTTIVAYFDVRCRVESFDLEHLAQLVEGEGVGAVPHPPGSYSTGPPGS